MKITPHALTTSDQYLIVLVTIDIANSQTVKRVRIPWEWLLDGEVNDHLDRAHRAALQRIWDAVEKADPLF